MCNIPFISMMFMDFPVLIYGGLTNKNRDFMGFIADFPVFLWEIHCMLDP